MGGFRKIYIWLVKFFHKFQGLIMAIIVFGFVDLIIYSDVLLYTFIMPEVAWPFLALLVCFSIYRFIK